MFKHSGIYIIFSKHVLSRQLGLYMLNRFEKPIYRDTNQANINHSKSTYTNEVNYINFISKHVHW